MSHSRDKRQQNQVLQLMLIEDDPVFRLGLIACLEPIVDLQIVLEADSTTRALELLRELSASTDPIPQDPTAEQRSRELSSRSLAVIILNLDLGQASSGHGSGLMLCQQLRVHYPQFPLLLLGSTLELTRLAAAFQSGAGGYCLKGTSVTELVTAIRQVAAGQSYWTESMQAIAANSAGNQSLNAIQLSQRSPLDTLPTHSPREPAHLGWLAKRRQNLRLSGVRQIERAIAELDAQLQTNPSLIDQLFLAGQRRELRTARWLVNRLLVSADEPTPPLQKPLFQTRPALEPERQAAPAEGSRQPLSEDPTALTPTIASSIQSPQAALFQATFTKLQANLQNLTGTALEIDILKDEKKRELLHIVLRKLQDILDDLRLQLPSEQLATKRDVILQDLWEATVTSFFGKYYTVQIEVHPIDVVTVLRQDRDIVQAAILDGIPLFPEFLSHLLVQTPLTIEGTDYATGTVEAMSRMELLLQHVTLQVANAVMQPLINRFGDVVAIKQAFYNQRLLSSREIERFRNDLSWKYRVDRIFAEPTAIFESQYRLLMLTGNGIGKTTIYAPRNDELANLSGVPFLITLVLETRDAIAPRVRAAVSFFGRGVVYVLTEIIGRGIGLIGRGIIKGIGNALQDTKPKRSERWR